MFKVSTMFLDQEARHADLQHGTVNRGQLDAAKLTELLENFRAIEAVEMIDLDPQIIAAGSRSRLIIRTNRKKLFVYNAANMNEAAAEMAPAEIMQRLNSVPAPVVSELPADLAAVPPPSRTGLAYALFAVALLVNLYTIYSVFIPGKTVNDKSGLSYITDPQEEVRRRGMIAGTYATGHERGDRILVIHQDGSMQSSEIGAPGNPPPQTGTYHLAELGQNLCLSVDDGGVVHVLDANTLRYYGDTYKRVQ